MTGKVIENSATGILILIVPFAFIVVILYSAWPLLLALVALGITLKVWQKSQWQKWSQKINPHFNELIRENQGCITALDLSLKASITGSNAEYFLSKKAEEYGAQRKVYQDKGTVYYFLTASALGSIFEDSEPIWELDQEEASLEQLSLEAANIPEIVSNNGTSESVSEEIVADLNPQSESVSEKLTQSTQNQSESHQEYTNGTSETSSPATAIASSLLQGELAKRLDVHSSTVGKRKLDSDFSEWSQKKDPEGIAWKFSRRRKVFSPIIEDE